MEGKKLTGAHILASIHDRWLKYVKDRRAAEAGEIRPPMPSELFSEALIEYMERHPVKKKKRSVA